MMTNDDFFGTVAIFGSLMAGLALLEIAIPFAATRGGAAGRRPTNLALSALAIGLNWLAMTGLAALLFALDTSGSGLVSGLGLPTWAELAIALLALDLATYTAHRLMHVIPTMWRFHRVHHADPFVDVTTALRQHPGEGLWRFAWTFGPALLLGLSPWAVAIYRTASVLNGLAEHVNVSLPLRLDRVISWLWVTPNMHKLHHSASRDESDTNYGNLFSFYDRIFRTFTPTDRALGIEYGLPGEVPREDAKSLGTLLRLPFADRAPEHRETSATA